MNVKEGDQAIVIWPGKVANNHFVEVKAFIPPGMPCTVGGKEFRGISDPAWWVECASPVRAKTGEMITEFPVRDANLRPIGTPEHGGVEQSTFQRPLPTLAESITSALNKLKYGSKS